MDYISVNRIQSIFLYIFFAIILLFLWLALRARRSSFQVKSTDPGRCTDAIYSIRSRTELLNIYDKLFLSSNPPPGTVIRLLSNTGGYPQYDPFPRILQLALIGKVTVKCGLSEQGFRSWARNNQDIAEKLLSTQGIEITVFEDLTAYTYRVGANSSSSEAFLAIYSGQKADLVDIEGIAGTGTGFHDLVALIFDSLVAKGKRPSIRQMFGDEPDSWYANNRERSAPEKIEYNINVGSFAGVLGDVSGSAVQTGDYSSIDQQLKSAGISESGRMELFDILRCLNASEPATRSKAKSGAMEWISKYGPVLGSLSDTIRGWIELAQGK
jgi:hypothetical protein